MKYLERRARLLPVGRPPLAGLLEEHCYAVEETVARGFTDSAKRTGYCAVLYTVSGSTVYRINGESVTLTPGSLLILPPGISFSERAPEVCHNRYLMLKGPLAEAIPALVPDDARFAFWPDCSPEVAAALGRCVALAHERPDIAAWKLAAELCLLVDKLIEHNPARRSGSPLPERVRRIVLESGGRGISVGALARAVGMSLSAFAHRFREQSGESPAAYVRKLRCEIARGHLETGLTVLETSLRLGFANPYHFSKVFASVMGVPPSRFIPEKRRLHRAVSGGVYRK